MHVRPSFFRLEKRVHTHVSRTGEMPRGSPRVNGRFPGTPVSRIRRCDRPSWPLGWPPSPGFPAATRSGIENWRIAKSNSLLKTDSRQSRGQISANRVGLSSTPRRPCRHDGDIVAEDVPPGSRSVLRIHFCRLARATLLLRTRCVLARRKPVEDVTSETGARLAACAADTWLPILF